MLQTSDYAFYSILRKIKLSQAGTLLHCGFAVVCTAYSYRLMVWRGVVRTHYNNKGSQEGRAATRPQLRPISLSCCLMGKQKLILLAFYGRINYVAGLLLGAASPQQSFLYTYLLERPLVML